MSDGPTSQLAQGAETESSGAIKGSRLVRIANALAWNAYVKSLEDRIAFLEAQLGSVGEVHNTQTKFPDLSLPTELNETGDPLRLLRNRVDESTDFVAQLASECLQQEHFCTQYKSRDGLSLLQSLLSDAVFRLPVTEKPDGHSILDEIPSERIVAIPSRESTTKLLDVYFEHCDFFSPILSSKEQFLDMVEPLYRDPTPDPSLVNVHFRALIVLGTSILLLNRVDFTVPLSKSKSYFNAAIRLFGQNTNMTCTGDLNHLTNLLLIVQYCCFAANITAAWHFLGLATRLAIELNVHKEPTSQSSFSQSERNERRWLFWSMYTFERNLCVIIGRPFSLPDGAIETPLPAHDTKEPQRALAIHSIKYRLLESEIYSTLNEKQYASVAFDRGIWRESLHQRLQEWHSSIPLTQKSTHLAPSEIFSGHLFNALVLLYYPSRYFPSPTADDLSILALNATNAILWYKKGFQSGELRFYWRTIHNLFRSGVAIIYCAQRDLIRQIPNLDLESARASINSCSSLLWGMVERYPAGKSYRDVFDKLSNAMLSQREEANDGHSLFQLPAETDWNFDELNFESDANPLSSHAFDTLLWGLQNYS
ncbi:fungal-specific transcription factor domain-containing protein [Penicillium herquei]|nr:fungal-specific transcription factor domain-containing protein [Penicillium herquei]